MSPDNTSGVQFAHPASPIEEKLDGDVTPVSHTDENEEHSAVSKEARLSFFLRLFLFFLIEAAFISLGAICLAKPVPINLPLKLSDADVKSGFTVIFIVWHSLAVIAGGHILADAFSREWSVQLAQSTQVVIGATDRVDRVSTVTSGFLDRISYFFTKRASGTFKLAFLASLSFMALTQLAPSAISAATTLVNFPLTVNIGNVVTQVVTEDDVGQLLGTGTRANLIARLELIEHTPFSVNLPSNMLVALPPGEDLKQNPATAIEYDTDVVEFNHECHWEAPTISIDTTIIPSQLVVSAGGQVWTTSLTVGQGNPGSSISPLVLVNSQLIGNVSLSTYLFTGGNSTYRDSLNNTEALFAIDLGDLPTLFVQDGVGVIAGATVVVKAPLASVLVCDPQIKISGGRASVSQNGTVDIISTGQPIIGNIPLSAANIILSNALQVALVTLESNETNNVVNNVASVMFMANSSVDWQTAQAIPPFDIPTINQQVDKFMGSAAKAFLDGYRKDGTTVFPTFNTSTVPAVGQNLRLALTTSKGLFITSIVVIAIAFALLYALCRSALTQQRYPFDLHNVFSVLQRSREGDTVRNSWVITGAPQPRRETV